MGEIMEEIEASIDSGKIKSIEELSNEFGIIEKNFSENFPNIPQKKEIWLTYVTKWQGFAAEQLASRSVRASRDEAVTLKEQLGEAIRNQTKFNREKAEAEQTALNRIHNLEDGISSLKKKLVHTEKERSTQENLIESFKLEKIEFEETLKKQISLQRNKVEQELKTQLYSQNSHDDEIFNYRSEHEKQMAIMEEKFTQQNDQLQLLRDRLKKKEDELNSLKLNYNNKLESIKNKFNEETALLKEELDAKSSKLTHLDKDYRKLENIHHFEKHNLQVTVEELQELNSSLTSQLTATKNRAVTVTLPVQDSSEVSAKLHKAEQQLQAVQDSEAAFRTKSRDLERQVEVEGNNARLVQDQ